MLTGIDHVLIACVDPDSAALELEAAVGLRASSGGRHEAHGTFNRLIWLGNSYIELMGVFDDGLAASSWWGRHALHVLSNARTAGESGGYMGLVLASDDLAADADRVRGLGSGLGEPEAGRRRRPDGRDVRWTLSHADAPDPDLGLLFLIEHDTTAAEWTAEEIAERQAAAHPMDGPAQLVRLEVPVATMNLATMRVHRDVGVAFRPSLAGAGARDGAVGRQTLRLIRGGHETTPRLVIRGGSRDRGAALLGCRWLLDAASGD